MQVRISLASIALFCATTLSLAGGARGDYKDERLGLSIQTPAGWTAIPMSVDERWKVAKFLCDKTYFWTEKGGWTEEHKPTMEVIAFVAEAVKEQVKIEKKQDKKTGRTEWRELSENPYKDYKDFLARRYTGGGWFISKEDETKVNDVAVSCYEIKVDKGSSDGPKHMFTWVYHLADVDVAVQFEVLENSVEKIRNEMTRCLKSLKPIPRTGGALYEPSTNSERFSWLDQDKLTPDERKSRRQGLEQKAHEKAAKSLPDGWVAKKMGRFMVLNHADEKFAKRVVDQAEAVWDWLDATFPFVGKEEYVRAPILRICKNEEEQRAFLKGGDWFGLNELEITTAQDFMGTSGWEMEWVNRRVMWGWFRDKDWDLSVGMPGWLSAGLSEFVGNLHVKNGKVDFSTDHWNKDKLREMEREGKLTPLKELVMLPVQSFYEDYWHKRIEGAALIAFFVTGKAAQQKRTKDLLSEYMRNLQGILQEDKKAKAGKPDPAAKKPQTEAEEDALFKSRAQGLKKEEQRLLEQTFTRTFASWSPADWKKFEAAYRKTF